MFKQIELNYNFNDLEPYIDELTMDTHYSKHHAAYTNNLNVALDKLPEFKNLSIEDILVKLPAISDDGLKNAVRNNGGGYYNHNLYFASLKPGGRNKPEDDLASRIEKDFGSFESLKEKLSSAAMGRFGSGWAWLSANKSGQLQVSSSPNQDNPIMESKGDWIPILGIDVWEHAYYLKYKNLRGDYIDSFFQILNWDVIAKNYAKVVSTS
ncbi:MAG: superoxide dismutase [Clostridiales bacterium]|jgi:Fe-Mn family superoxide dismutase|nr:superoxide dismutase [Bacillota bacterium]NLK03756.1 superoxide dismutase [Clostridiales bacterium]